MRDFDPQKFIRIKLIGDAIIASIAIIAVGIIGPKANPHIQMGWSIFIAIATAYILSMVIIRSFGAVYPPTRKKWFTFGTIWGALWGLGCGLILGWGGGAFDFGLVPWIIQSVIFGSLGIGVWSSFGPHD